MKCFRFWLPAFALMFASAQLTLAQSTGACCYETGTCSLTTQAECQPGGDFGGYFRGVGTNCQTPGICARSCCRLASCGFSMTDTCSDGRRLPPGQSCEAGCTGACCQTNGTCSQVGATTCASGGGAYRGNETTCATTVCGGACCTEAGACRSSSPEACVNNDEFMGLGTTCWATDCIGACCHPEGDCFEVGTEMACSQAGGSFRGRGTRCAFTQCAGACCLVDKGCVETTSEACVQFSGSYQGEGSFCGEECPSKVSTGFTYHGQLKQNGVPYTGPVALEFSLWDLPLFGELVQGPITMDNVSAVNGLFQTVVDFGEGSFGHGARWLEVAVCAEDCTSPDNFTLLQPRQLITPVPFAMQTRGIVVDAAGNVGIHTHEPAKELDVAGVVKSRQLHLADTDGLPMARWDGQRFEPGSTHTVSSGPPSSATSSGSTAWSNTSAVLVSDDVRATVALNQSAQGQGILRVTGFNFNIPPDATVTSVVAFIEASGTCSCTSCSGSSSCSVSLPARLVSDGTLGSWNSGFHLSETESNLGTGFGAPEWTPAMFNSPGFGMEISGRTYVSVLANCGGPWQPIPCAVPCYSCSATGGASIDSVVRMEITYRDHDVVVDRQWSVGLAGEQAQFLIAPTSNLSTPAMTILTNGKIGLGTVTNPFYHLQLPNVADVSTGLGSAQARTWFTYSSKRWKENIQRIPEALEKVLQIEGVTFDWAAAQGGQRDIGFVAEDVAKVVPELVDMEPDGQFARGMKYDRVTALAIEAIKELNAKLAQREQEIEELKARLERLEAK